MRILLLGGGGREHALAWKLHQSPRCEALFSAPGNAGTAREGANVELADFAAIAAFCGSERIELVVVGPEQPLVAGVVDYLAEHAPDVKVVGPSREGARLEGSKAYAKTFMAELDIPTAGYRSFIAAELAAGKAYLESLPNGPYVLKADGLAAGKGVLIIEDLAEAKQELEAMLAGRFGDASEVVVVEEFLAGPEFSVFVLTDGTDYQLLPVARDYKRVGEGDTGPNTGGMGAVSPVSYVDKHVMAKVRERIVEPTVRGIRERGIGYRGFIFLGLILVGDEPYVIEYNCRLGDPETEAVLPRLKSDLVELLDGLFDGTLGGRTLSIDSRAAATLVLASGGYPGAYEKGKVITGVDAVEQSRVFLAGVREDGGQLLTDGGRVLAVTCFGLSTMEAAESCRRAAAGIAFDGGFYRKDIGV